MTMVSYAKTPTELRAEMVKGLDHSIEMQKAKLTQYTNRQSRSYDKGTALLTFMLNYRADLARLYVDDKQYVEPAKADKA